MWEYAALEIEKMGFAEPMPDNWDLWENLFLQ